jgi:hypothetical protein
MLLPLPFSAPYKFHLGPSPAQPASTHSNSLGQPSLHISLLLQVHTPCITITPSPASISCPDQRLSLHPPFKTLSTSLPSLQPGGEEEMKKNEREGCGHGLKQTRKKITIEEIWKRQKRPRQERKKKKHGNEEKERIKLTSQQVKGQRAEKVKQKREKSEKEKKNGLNPFQPNLFGHPQGPISQAQLHLDTRHIRSYRFIWLRLPPVPERQCSFSRAHG